MFSLLTLQFLFYLIKAVNVYSHAPNAAANRQWDEAVMEYARNTGRSEIAGIRRGEYMNTSDQRGVQAILDRNTLRTAAQNVDIDGENMFCTVAIIILFLIISIAGIFD